MAKVKSVRSSRRSRRSRPKARRRPRPSRNIRTARSISAGNISNRTNSATKSTTDSNNRLNPADKVKYSDETKQARQEQGGSSGKAGNKTNMKGRPVGKIVSNIKSMNKGLKDSKSQNKDETGKVKSSSDGPGKTNINKSEERAKEKNKTDETGKNENKANEKNKTDETGKNENKTNEKNKTDETGKNENKTNEQNKTDEAGKNENKANEKNKTDETGKNENKADKKELTEEQKKTRRTERIKQIRQDIDKLKKVVDFLTKNRGKMSTGQWHQMLDQAKVSASDMTDKLNNINGDWSNSGPSKKWNDLVGAWRQGSEGNCVSVATIKAAMHKWGNKVFEKMDKTSDGGYNIKMRDGAQVSLSGDEMSTARRMSSFRSDGQFGNEQAREYANVLYGAMAKRALWAGHEGARTYRRACHSLNNGENPAYPAKFLGVSQHLKRINISDIPKERISILWTNRHAMYSTYGNTDRWGSNSSYRNWRLRGAYAFK